MSAGGAGGREVGRISIRIVPNLDSFRKKVIAEIGAVEKSVRGEVTIDAHLDTLKARGDMRGLMARLKAVAAEGVSIKTDVDRSMLDKVRGIASGADGGSLLGNLASSRGLAVGILAVSAALALAGPLAGVLATGLSAIPGLLAAVATPLGALALGIDGLKAAASSIAAPFEVLKATMSAATESQFTPVFKQLATIFPLLGNALPAVTQGVADLMAGFTNMVTSAPGMAKVESIIGNIAAAMTAASPGVTLFTNGLLGLADQLTQKLPAVSEWLNTLGARFSEWVSQVSADGSLSAAFDGLGATISQIVNSLTPILQQGINFMADPEKITALTATIETLGYALQGVVWASSQFFEGITRFAMFLETSYDRARAKIQEIVVTATSAVGEMIAKINSVSGAVSNAWNAIPGIAAGIFNTVVATVATSVAQIFTTFVNVGAQIMGEVAGWPGRIVGALGDLGGLLVGAGQALMNGLLAGIKSGLQAVLDFASGIAAKIAAVKGPIPKDRKTLTPAGLALMEGLQDGIESGTQPVLDKARALAEEIATAIDQGLAGVDMTSLSDRLDQTMDEIGLRQSEMQVEYDTIPKEDKEGRKAFQSKRDQLKEIKNILALQEEQLGFSEKYGASEEKNANQLGDSLTKMLDIGKGFAEANVGQFADDLGIGGGALSAALEQGSQFGMSLLSDLVSGAMGGGTTIQVNSVDEAVAADKRIAARKALQYYR